MNLSIEPCLAIAAKQWQWFVALLACVGVLATCTPVQPKPPAAPVAPTTPEQIKIQPVSQAVDRFLWQTDGIYGYRMLRPAAWEASSLGTARGYFPSDATLQTTPLLLTAVNWQALAEIAQVSQQVVVPYQLFQRDPQLADWGAAMEQKWQEADLPYTLLQTLPDAQIYAFIFSETGFIQLAAYVISDGKPFLLQLESRDGVTLEQLRDRGIFADFITMVELSRW